MRAKADEIDLLQAARCEDLQYGQIKELSVLGDFERKVIVDLSPFLRHPVKRQYPANGGMEHGIVSTKVHA